MKVNEQQLNELVDKIVEAVHPLRVILFGSAARDEAGSESDLDVLVVMPDGTHRRHTAQRLYLTIKGVKTPFDLLVATPSDLEKHRDNPGLIYRTILKEGRTVYAAREVGSPEEWLRYAYSDLDIAEGPPGPRVMLGMLCFHAQQAVEKSLKAVLLKYGVSFPPTHNLRILFDLLPVGVASPPEVERAIALSDYAVEVRYPSEYEAVAEEEYREALQFARFVVAWAEAALRGDAG